MSDLSKPRWLDRRIAAPAPYLALCLSQQDFDAALKHIKVKEQRAYINAGAHATTHYYNNDEGNTVAIVCLSGHEGRNPIEVAGLLVHEAVHVWQTYADDIGEKDPGREQEAYAVQIIAQELMSEFARRMK